MSLKELVELHGFGVKVKSDSFAFKDHPFTIISEDPMNNDCYIVQYESGHRGPVLKECKQTNDYHRFEY